MTLLPTPQNPMLLFGCGNMGRAMLDGWLGSGITPTCFVVVDPYAQGLPEGVAHYRQSTELEQRFHIALIAIKPQMIGELAADIEKLLASDAMAISILAGTRIDTLATKFPGRTILRLMPNLAASLGKSPLGLFAAADLDKVEIETLLQPLGTSHWQAQARPLSIASSTRWRRQAKAWD
jgi:pyrroline-5-carboxylate reductase